jgi:hypothetical protein
VATYTISQMKNSLRKPTIGLSFEFELALTVCHLLRVTLS